MRDEKETASVGSVDASSSSLSPPSTSLSLITLLTDFGTADYFVGAMKGVILSVNPRARIVDLTHEIPPHDIHAAAFTILAAYKAFTEGTIHVCVVDPGVGSERRPLLFSTGKHFFVGPDNGLFSYVCEREAVETRVFHLTNSDYFRHPVSPTFHGRDLFAPVAAALSNGVEPVTLGHEIMDFVRLEPLAVRAGDGMLEASVIHVDRFGNCITSITRRELTEEMLKNGARLKIKGREIRSFRNYFAQNSDAQSELFAVWGSAGFLEIALLQASAAHLLGISRGEPVYVLTA